MQRRDDQGLGGGLGVMGMFPTWIVVMVAS